MTAPITSQGEHTLATDEPVLWNTGMKNALTNVVVGVLLFIAHQVFHLNAVTAISVQVPAGVVSTFLWGKVARDLVSPTATVGQTVTAAVTRAQADAGRIAHDLGRSKVIDELSTLATPILDEIAPLVEPPAQEVPGPAPVIDDTIPAP